MSDEENLNLSKYITVTGFLFQHLVIPCVVVVSSITQHTLDGWFVFHRVADGTGSFINYISSFVVLSVLCGGSIAWWAVPAILVTFSQVCAE